MYCYRCSNDMKKKSYKGVLVDYCENCRSFWLDGGEFESVKYNKEQSDKDLALQARKEIAAENLITYSGACPKCSGKMTKQYKSGVQVDQCASCDGVFFDYGELQECLEREEFSLIEFIALSQFLP